MQRRKNNPFAVDSKAQALSAQRKLQLARDAYRTKLGLAPARRNLWGSPLTPAAPPKVAKPE